MDNIQQFLGNIDLSVSEAMQHINRNAWGILFIVDKNSKLLGCITDGDIRRFLLSGGTLEAKAINAANNKPKVATTVEEARHLYHQKFFFLIPIVDKNGIIIDLYGGETDGKNKKKDILNIPVVINAGGKGTRLEPFTKILPKPLIPVGELPIIEHIMNSYQEYACNKFHVIVNYKKELMKAYFSDNEKKYDISWYNEDKPLGTGGGLSLLKGKLDGTFFFINCDTLILEDYADILKFHKENKNLVTMICAYKNITLPYGIVDIGKNGKIESMKEKPSMSFLTNTGMYIVEPEVINVIDPDVPIGFPSVVEKLKKQGKNVGAYPISEKDWLDMGQLDELEKMRVRLYGDQL